MAYVLYTIFPLLVQLLQLLQPRLILSGHTHSACTVFHGDVQEISIPSFSWRNRNNPSFMMVWLYFPFICESRACCMICLGNTGAAHTTPYIYIQGGHSLYIYNLCGTITVYVHVHTLYGCFALKGACRVMELLLNQILFL